MNAAWDFTGNARGGTAVDGVSATKNGSQPASAIELTTNKTGSGATMTVLTNTKCEWNGKLQFSTGKSDNDLFTITADADCTAVIKVGSSSGSKTSGRVNALKLGSTVIYDFDSKDTKDATEKTVSLKKGANTFSGSGVCILKVTLSASTTPTTPPATGDSGTTTTGSGSSGSGDTTGTGTSGGTTAGDDGNGASDDPGSAAASIPLTFDATKFAEIATKIPASNAPVTPSSSDADTSASIKAVSLQLGEGMKIDSSRFNVGGSLQKKGKNAIIFTAPTGATKVEVHFYNNGANNGGRKLQIAKYDEDSVSATDGTKETVANSKDDITEEFDITAGEKYMLGGTNGLYITKFVIK